MNHELFTTMNLLAVILFAVTGFCFTALAQSPGGSLRSATPVLSTTEYTPNTSSFTARINPSFTAPLDNFSGDNNDFSENGVYMRSTVFFDSRQVSPSRLIVGDSSSGGPQSVNPPESGRAALFHDRHTHRGTNAGGRISNAMEPWLSPAGGAAYIYTDTITMHESQRDRCLSGGWVPAGVSGNTLSEKRSFITGQGYDSCVIVLSFIPGVRVVNGASIAPGINAITVAPGTADLGTLTFTVLPGASGDIRLLSWALIARGDGVTLSPAVTSTVARSDAVQSNRTSRPVSRGRSNTPSRPVRADPEGGLFRDVREPAPVVSEPRPYVHPETGEALTRGEMIQYLREKIQELADRIQRLLRQRLGR